MREFYGEPVWEDADYPQFGITSLATAQVYEGFDMREIVGYNGILRGDYVTYDGKRWRVVMVSRMGDFGLSETDALPYTKRVNPDKVVKE